MMIINDEWMMMYDGYWKKHSFDNDKDNDDE